MTREEFFLAEGIIDPRDHPPKEWRAAVARAKRLADAVGHEAARRSSIAIWAELDLERERKVAAELRRSERKTVSPIIVAPSTRALHAAALRRRGMTLKQIGDAMKVTAERARMLSKRAEPYLRAVQGDMPDPAK